MALGSINACSSANRYPRGYNKGGQVKPQCKKIQIYPSPSDRNDKNRINLTCLHQTCVNAEFFVLSTAARDLWVREASMKFHA